MSSGKFRQFGNNPHERNVAVADLDRVTTQQAASNGVSGVRWPSGEIKRPRA
jgi:hypothetical protein